MLKRLETLIRLLTFLRGGDPAFWEEPASWEGTCILGGNYFFKLII